MRFAKGQEVWVNSLNEAGRIVSKLPGGRYEVLVKKFRILVKEVDLSLPKPSRRKTRLSSKTMPKITTLSRSSAKALSRIDLHGMHVETALREVEKRLSDAICADIPRLEIIHGVGTGALLGAVHRYLGASTLGVRFRLDELNPGVTWVYFDD